MHQNIYFQKEVWDKFNNESNKSNLINQLLRDYYELGELDRKNPTGGASSNSSVPSQDKKINELKSQFPGLKTAAEIKYEDVY